MDKTPLEKAREREAGKIHNCSECERVFEVVDSSGDKFTVYGIARNDDEYGTTDFLIFNGIKFEWKESEYFIPADGGADNA